MTFEAAGFVARRAHTDDGRQVYVVTSADANGYLHRFDRAWAEIVADAAAKMSLEHHAALEAAIPALESPRDALILRRGTPSNEAKSA